MSATPEPPAGWYELTATWAPLLVAIIVASLAFLAAVLVRRHEARQARDEMTRRAAAEVWSAAMMLLRAAVAADDEGQPEIWKYQPAPGMDRGAYDRYNDALQHAWNCHGVLIIWRPELERPASKLLLAYATFEASDKKKQVEAQGKARTEFLTAVRRTLGDRAPKPLKETVKESAPLGDGQDNASAESPKAARPARRYRG